MGRGLAVGWVLLVARVDTPGIFVRVVVGRFLSERNGRATVNTKLTADESADFLRLALKAHIPFFFTKYGDGALELLNGLGSRTCDHERYTPELRDALEDSWQRLQGFEHLYLGDWLSARFDEEGTGRYEDLYAMFTAGCGPVWLNYSALLLDRETPELRSFYRALKEDTRRKVLMGPREWAQAKRFLGADIHIVTPMGGVFPHIDQLREQIFKAEPEILLYGAGMAGTIPVIDHWWENSGDVTYINLGSALDAIYRGPSRKQALPQIKARHLMKGLL